MESNAQGAKPPNDQIGDCPPKPELQEFPPSMGQWSPYEDDRIEWYKAAAESRK